MGHPVLLFCAWQEEGIHAAPHRSRQGADDDLAAEEILYGVDQDLAVNGG